MDKTKILFVVAFLFVAITIFALANKEQGTDVEPGAVAAVFAEIDSEREPQGSVFEGVIDNADVKPGTINGVGAYDRSCRDAGNGLTQCDGGIVTDEYGLLNFSYTHDMHADPCIAPDQLFVVEILDDSGTAVVKRLF